MKKLAFILIVGALLLGSGPSLMAATSAPQIVTDGNGGDYGSGGG